jgi:hypothetical protein
MKKPTRSDLTVFGGSQAEIVAVALHRLGGAQHPVDTEDVAVEAHRLAPGRFSWRKYPDQINLELIRVFLSDAKKVGLVIGTGRAGWRMSQKGLQWADEASHALETADTSRTRAQLRSGSPEEQRWRRERTRILNTPAWRAWESGGDIPPAQAKEVFRIDSYARGELREAKITRLYQPFSDQPDIEPFLTQLIEIIKSEPDQ